jgi:hypothetical protein
MPRGVLVLYARMVDLLFAKHVLGIHGNHLLPPSQFNPDPDEVSADSYDDARNLLRPPSTKEGVARGV